MVERKHNYDYESQGVMAITGKKEIDFIDYNNDTLYIETTKFEEEKWHQETLPLITKFHLQKSAQQVIKN